LTNPRTGTTAEHGWAGPPLTAPLARPLEHVPGLDGVRAVAVVTVIVLHLGILRPFEPNALPGGHLGVDLFFVLSGFLITSLLLKEHDQTGRIRLLAFYGRRALRLFPALAFLLVVYTLYSSSQGVEGEVQRNTVGAAGFYIMNWIPSWGWPFDAQVGHLWSLSIEEQFYLVWPLILIGLLATRIRVVAALLLIATTVVVVMAHRDDLMSTVGEFLTPMRTDARADALLAGCLAAILWSFGLVPRRVLPWLATAATVLLGWFWMEADPQMFARHPSLYTAAAVTMAVVVVAVVDGRWFLVPVLSLRPVRAIGRVSYGLYLWHFPVFVAVQAHNPDWSSTVQMVVGLVVMTAITLFSWFVVEKPCLRLKHRLEPRSVATPAPRLVLGPQTR
jgi:peptidoglycan/LPS O-acetylase OafA/YrhL